MKKRILLLFILTILFSTGMEGCPELDPMNYVEFTLTTNVNLHYTDTNWDPLDVPTTDTVIKIETIKAGGERCVEDLITGASGTVTLICKHNVYKEQLVESVATFVALPASLAELGYKVINYEPGGGGTWVVFGWDEIFSICGNKFGSSCASTFTLTVQVNVAAL